MKRKSLGQRILLGYREQDDDGFTYRYGKHKGGFVKRSRHNNSIRRCKRADKRNARNFDLKIDLEGN